MMDSFNRVLSYTGIVFCFYAPSLQTNPENLVDLAKFMGLDASLEEVQKVQETHHADSLHESFETYGLSREAIKYMNETMIRLLPQEMLARYGLSSTSG